MNILSKIFSSSIVVGILKYRHIWLPVLSILGVLFFIFARYYDYPTTELLITFVWLYYILFCITKYGKVKFEKDSKGNLFITQKPNENENNEETEY